MANIDNLVVSFLLLDEKTRLRKTQKATNRLANYLNDTNEYTDKQVFRFFVDVVSLFVSADHGCGEEEWKLFNDILDSDYSYPQFAQATDGGNDPVFKERMFKKIAALPRRIKNDVVTIGLAFLVSDKELSPTEKVLFKKVLNAK